LSVTWRLGASKSPFLLGGNPVEKFAQAAKILNYSSTKFKGLSSRMNVRDLRKISRYARNDKRVTNPLLITDIRILGVRFVVKRSGLRTMGIVDSTHPTLRVFQYSITPLLHLAVPFCLCDTMNKPKLRG
jgi:hypothetical protein